MFWISKHDFTTAIKICLRSSNVDIIGHSWWTAKWKLLKASENNIIEECNMKENSLGGLNDLQDTGEKRIWSKINWQIIEII